VSRALEKERLRSENERLNALVPLFELNKTLMTTIKEDELVDSVLGMACNEMDADLGLLALRGRDGDLYLKSAYCSDAALLSPPIVAQVTEVAQSVLEDRQQVMVRTSDTIDASVRHALRLLDAQCMLINPLLAMDAPLGVLLLARTEPDASFGTGDRELASVLCGQAAIALQNARLFQEIQRAYQELQELDHMKSEFVNIAAHELRTPLAILMGHADLLAEDTQDPQVKERLQIIVRNALRLRDLVQALLDMRHLQTGEERVQIAGCDLEALIASALQDFRPIAEQRRLRISARIPPDLPQVQTDHQKVFTTLSNLIQNAIRFTPEGGELGIDVCNQGDETWVSVWDTGIGIPEDQY
jgi:signal transduction histidine kinase